MVEQSQMTVEQKDCGRLSFFFLLIFANSCSALIASSVQHLNPDLMCTISALMLMHDH
jgi:hypothetical protein